MMIIAFLALFAAATVLYSVYYAKGEMNTRMDIWDETAIQGLAYVPYSNIKQLLKIIQSAKSEKLRRHAHEKAAFAEKLLTTFSFYELYLLKYVGSIEYIAPIRSINL